MSNASFVLPEPKNEPVWDYAPKDAGREKLQATLKELRSQVQDIPMIIGGEEVRTGNTINCVCPHDHQHILAHAHLGSREHVEKAIESALKAREKWAAMPWEHRAAIFLKAAELIAGPYRARMNAATMLTQSKNAHQSEIDAICELVDFLRFNVKYMEEIYTDQQRHHASGIWNRLEYRPLEGFVAAVTPFNFTAIAGNLPSCMAMMGNVVVWKPAQTQIYSAALTMEIFREAGLPDGVINLVYTPGPDFSDVILKHPDFAGIHFTGSTRVFQSFWREIGNNIERYKSYPRIVGETGGKDFVVAHPSADPLAVATNLVRGAFEFQGQKCSAASRAYVPKSLWPVIQDHMNQMLDDIKMGPVEDFSNFVNAVIDKKAFDSITSYIDYVKDSDEAGIVYGGNYDDSKGYFIEPTVILTNNPDFRTMQEEIFGPVLSIYAYEDSQWDEILKVVDNTSPYALTGAVFARCREAVVQASDALKNAAGNFYINDKPTGAVVGQQPFGGARASGTNDKAGARQNLMRWVSTRTIKETFVSPTNYRYPFLG